MKLYYGAQLWPVEEMGRPKQGLRPYVSKSLQYASINVGIKQLRLFLFFGWGWRWQRKRRHNG